MSLSSVFLCKAQVIHVKDTNTVRADVCTAQTQGPARKMSALPSPPTPLPKRQPTGHRVGPGNQGTWLLTTHLLVAPQGQPACDACPGSPHPSRLRSSLGTPLLYPPEVCSVLCSNSPGSTIQLLLENICGKCHLSERAELSMTSESYQRPEAALSSRYQAPMSSQACVSKLRPNLHEMDGRGETSSSAPSFWRTTSALKVPEKLTENVPASARYILGEVSCITVTKT